MFYYFSVFLELSISVFCIIDILLPNGPNYRPNEHRFCDLIFVSCHWKYLCYFTIHLSYSYCWFYSVRHTAMRRVSKSGRSARSDVGVRHQRALGGSLSRTKVRSPAVNIPQSFPPLPCRVLTIIIYCFII